MKQELTGMVELRKGEDVDGVAEQEGVGVEVNIIIHIQGRRLKLACISYQIL